MTNNGTSIGKFRKFFEAYEALCKPYCNEIGISVQAFEIILLINRRQGVSTAQDICKQQSIKPTLMSFHIEKLVQAGYVERQSIDGNRRSISLVCTESAMPIIKKGKELSEKFTSLMMSGVSEDEAKQLFATLAKINANADKIINGEF